MRSLHPRAIDVVAALLVSLALAGPARAASWVFTANLSGSNEDPPVNSPGTGTTSVTIDDVANTMRLQVSFSGLIGNTTVVHIHAPTAIPFAGNVGVATTLPSLPDFPTGVTSGTYDRLFDMTQASSYNPAFLNANGGTTASAQAALFASFFGGRAYLNVHSSFSPPGEIRGFLVLVPEPSPAGGVVALCLLGAGLTLKRSLSKP